MSRELFLKTMKRKLCPHNRVKMRCYECQKAKGKVAHGRKEIKKLSKSKLEKDFDDIYSFYIRLKDCDERGYGRCISCGSVKHYTDLQNGHYIARIAAPHLIFYEPNTHAQCTRCNGFLEGNTVSYRFGLIDKIGIDAVNLLESLRHKQSKSGIGAFEYQVLIHEYINKLDREVKRTGAELSKTVEQTIKRWTNKKA